MNEQNENVMQTYVKLKIIWHELICEILTIILYLVYLTKYHNNKEKASQTVTKLNIIPILCVLNDDLGITLFSSTSWNILHRETSKQLT